MSQDNWTDIVSAAGTVVAAGAAVYAAWLANQASETWRSSLEYERIDDAIRAVQELRSKIERVVSLKEEGLNVWDAYTDAWTSWSRFNQAYTVARRYRPTLLETVPTTFENELRNVKEPLRIAYDQATFRKLQTDVRQLTNNTVAALRGIPAPGPADAHPVA